MRAHPSWRALALVIIMVALPAFAQAETIEKMNVTLDVQRDASVVVSEFIAYDFGDAQRHGIYRDITERYIDRNGGTESIAINDVNVTNASGTPVTFKVNENSGTIRIQIGDADRLVTGLQKYVITYTVNGAIGFFSDHDEVYWNATGNGWQVSIRDASVGVWTPVDSTSHACYVGVIGSTETCTSSARRDGANKPIVLFTSRTLSPGEGLTVAVGVPKGVIREPPASARIWQWLSLYWPFALPSAALLILMYAWWKYGRDARGRGTIIPEYDPPERLSVAAVSEIVNQKVGSKDISAIMIHLAIAGHLRITRTEQKTFGIFTSADYTLDKLKDTGREVAPEEKIVFDALFPAGVTQRAVSDIKSSRALIAVVGLVNKSVGKRMVQEGYYRADPTTVRASFIFGGIALFVAAIMLFTFDLSLVIAMALALSGALVLLFSIIMPAKTKKGAFAKESILGLKEYLQIAEKNRLDFHNAPEKSPALFERLLPYAMALGVSTAWAKEFEGIYTEPPRWYAGGVYPVFSPTAFADDIGAFSTAAAAMASPTSGSGGSGGGGFSGGGFGGGGGGSW